MYYKQIEHKTFDDVCTMKVWRWDGVQDNDILILEMEINAI